jgi:hypothetical protein
MVSAEELQVDLIKRGAAEHVRDCQLLINAVERAMRAANYTAGTGKVHHDDKAAHAKVKRAYNRLMRMEEA